MSEEAENAVRCFERWSRTHVVFYHNDMRLTALFPVNRCLHKENICQNIKACGHEQDCHQFDRHRLLSNAWKFRNGGIKLCRGGVWEWIHAVYDQENLLGMLLAGARRANPEFARKYPVYTSPEPRWQLPAGCDTGDLLPVDAENHEDEFVMEGLRQLAARLRELGCRLCEISIGENRLSPGERLRLLIDRQYRNEGFGIATLAKYYHLSTSRMYHMIKKETGKSLKEPVNEIRLTEACNLQENSSFLVRQISDYCAFSTPAYFFRTFKARYGMTPQEYRNAFLRGESDTHRA